MADQCSIFHLFSEEREKQTGGVCLAILFAVDGTGRSTYRRVMHAMQSMEAGGSKPPWLERRLERRRKMAAMRCVALRMLFGTEKNEEAENEREKKKNRYSGHDANSG